jgi:hypothetical protein
MRERAKSAVSAKEKDEYLSSVDPQWSGAVLYRSVIPAERVKAHAPGHRAITKQTQVLHIACPLVKYTDDPYSTSENMAYVNPLQ